MQRSLQLGRQFGCAYRALALRRKIECKLRLLALEALYIFVEPLPGFEPLFCLFESLVEQLPKHLEI
ncbi:MAG: hypothetical protein ACREJX_10045, partial [Polyangiaceae bacterium]